MKMNMYDSSASSSSIGYLSADSSSDSDSVSSNMLEEELHHDIDDPSSSPSPQNDHMFELSDLISQLPIKRGLSNYYNGKSDSFKNLISVKSLEDVPKNRSQRSRSLYTMKKKKHNKARCVGLGLSDKNQNNKQDKYYYTTPKSKISKENIKVSTKASVLMNTWSGSSRFIHV